MATSGGFLGSLKSLPSKLGVLGGKLGSAGRTVASKVQSLPGAKWTTERVKEVAVPTDVVRGYQDIYKGLKTLKGSEKVIRTVRVVRDPASVAKAVRGSASAVKTAARSSAARGGSAVIREGRDVLVRSAKVRIPGGIREIKSVDVTSRQFIGSAAKSGTKIAKGAGSAAKNAGSVAKGAARGAGKAGKVISETTTTTIKDVARKGFKAPFGLDAIKQGLKGLMTGALKAAKVSGVISAALSVVTNTYGVLSGQKGIPEAIGSVVADTAGGFVAGGFAALFSGGVLAFAGALGLTAALPVFLLGLGASIAAFALCNALFHAAIGDRLKDFVQNVVGG